jgi:hypothetical protein
MLVGSAESNQILTLINKLNSYLSRFAAVLLQKYLATGGMK